MLLVVLPSIAAAAPESDAYEALRTRLLRAEAVDELLGAPTDPREDAWRMRDCAACAPLLAQLTAETTARDEARAWVLRVEPRVSLAIGDRTPAHADGDVEAGLVSARASADVRLYHGLFEAQLRPEFGIDAIRGVSALAELPEWRLGVRTHGFHATAGAASRWFGPGRDGTLLVTDHARPLPALDVGGDARLPGKADLLGRFGVSFLAGALPGARSDVDHPLWLLLDLRWAPVPWIEVGLARNAVFGGSEGGVARPIRWGQVILPTHPHVYDDPEQIEADTDERAAWDVRITPPLGRWGVPVLDYAEVAIQHGGEDVITRRGGLFPWPTLAGSANVYGAEIGALPYSAGVEVAVIEDDLYRWYVGHRVYHDGWTVDGAPIGHPNGGDQRTTTVRIGRFVDRGLAVDVLYRHTHRVDVADLVGDTLFVFPAAEVRDEIGLRGSTWLGQTARITVDLGAGPVRGRGFVPGDHDVEWRGSVGLSGPVVLKSAR